MIEQNYLDEARAMISTAGWGTDRSSQWHEGLLNCVAWHLAGMPQGYGRSACPYEIKTPERDAWLDGWMVGKAAAEREDLGSVE